MDFPTALRTRRRTRRISQLDLAIRAGTTQRHLSFLESGRSAPGRTLVVRLAESLELPLRERNELLTAAGYAPVYPQTPLDELTAVRTALRHVLAGHEPYPAVVVDRYGTLVDANRALGILTEDVATELLTPPVNVYRLALHPHGMAPRIRNFAQWAQHVVDNARHEFERHPSSRLEALLEELGGYLPDHTPGRDHVGFAVPLHLASSRGELHLTTTVTTFATALDVTVAELKLEAFLPADEPTAELLRHAVL
ncbi:helix-turn-helix domain-containing protein [Cryptosporangium sp. NPDC051539]|uniref:helix-turn-helix domain-containing protein n=1 Tax=Cryptosporangium sp. NPDC051539 TaxID=3363962 RepID=UPI00379FDEAF